MVRNIYIYIYILWDMVFVICIGIVCRYFVGIVCRYNTLLDIICIGIVCRYFVRCVLGNKNEWNFRVLKCGRDG